MSIAVAMIEPQYEVNVGHVARVMKNFGYGELYFMSPRFDKLKALKYSTHGSDVLENAETLSLEELRKKFDILIGTTAHDAKSNLNMTRSSIDLDKLNEIIINNDRKTKYCIVLGRESSGMKNNELEYCNLVLVLDTQTQYNTLNISHALAIILYQISRSSKRKIQADSKKPLLASKEQIDLLISYANKLAMASQYDEHKRPLLNSAIRKLMGRSSPTSKEVMLIVSLFRKNLIKFQRYSKLDIK